jgi:hypothetical protein
MELRGLKFVPAGVHLFLVFLSHVVKPVLFVQKLLAAIAAFHNSAFVEFPRMLHQLIVAGKPPMAFLAFMLLAMQEIHKN